MGLGHGLLLLLLGLMVSIGVFWLIAWAESETQVERRQDALKDLEDRLDG